MSTCEKKCNEWERLDNEKLLQRALNFPTWTLIELDSPCPKLKKSFTCKDFQSAIDYIVEAGKIAESRNHHPDFHLVSYRNVEVVIYTHSLSGVTDNDFDLAAAFDNEIKPQYSPKFLKENPLFNVGI